MAIAKMKKAFVLAHESERSQLVDELQRQGYLHVTAAPPPEPGEPHVPTTRYEEEAERLELLLSRVQFVLDFLERFREAQRGFISSLMKPKVEVSWSDFTGIEGKVDFEAVYAACEALDDRLRVNEQQLSRLRVEQARLAPWKELDAPLAEIRGTDGAVVRAGRVPTTRADLMAEELAHEAPASEIITVSRSHEGMYLVLLYHREAESAVHRVAIGHGFEAVDLTGFAGRPADEIERLRREAADLEANGASARQEAAAKTALIPDLIVLRDWLANRRRRWLIQSSFQETTSTFLLEGWVETERASDLEKALRELTDVVDYDIVEPLPDEEPPVVLKNPRILKPFEVLIQLYGLPNYREQDPTPVMAPFFILFFGVALGDFGYGLVLALVCQWLKRRLPVGPVGRLWLDLFTFGGLSSMLVGVLTGGYFGVETSALPTFLQRFVLFDPLKEAFIFLMVTWLLGVIHVLVGLVVETVDGFRHGAVADAIYDHVTTLLLVTAGVLAGGIWLVTTVLKTGGWLTPALPFILRLLLLGAVAVAIFQGRFFSHYLEVIGQATARAREGAWTRLVSDQLPALVALLLLVAGLMTAAELRSNLLTAGGLVLGVGMVTSASTRTAVARLGSGLYSLYGMSGFIGDFLSYSRLMALGLATVLIGFVVNTFIRLVWGFPLPLAIVASVAIALIGHSMNLLINLLGAFVHPLRLQFVEFFKYFYEDGGQGFRPFSFETDHLLFKD